MKHVGVNVAADPLFTAAYTGVGGGMVVLAADDPGMYSSQNEQDSRYYAQAAHIPMLDPADSAEALSFTREAFDLSERFDVPFFIRSTVRVSHTKTLVEPGAQGGGTCALRVERGEVGHDARVRQASAQGAAQARRRPPRVRRRVRVQPPRAQGGL